jgi:RNA polymerase sigma-70 factor (ECF subfamily)
VADARLTDSSDASLVLLVARFDESALAEIYRRHSGPVFSLATRLLRDRQIAEDVTQEVFVRIWNEPHCFDPERGALRTFLLTTTHHRAVDIIRSNSSRRRREENDVRQMEIVVDGIEREVLDLATAEQVKEVFNELPESERSAIEMTYFRGHSYVEAARLLQQPEGTVKSRIRSGLRRMRDLLPASMEER